MRGPSWILTVITAATAVTGSVLPTKVEDDDDDIPMPLVIWHGLGDNYAAEGIENVGQIADKIHPSIFVYNIRIDDDASADRSATFLGNLTLQIEKVCQDLASHPILSSAPVIDAVGFSQGGQFLRGYIERCNYPPVRNLITFGSQHNGISEFQKCGNMDWICKGANALLRGNTWSSFIQSRLVPAQYFRDPLDIENYLEHSNFLADINNERILKNRTYKENLVKLENFVMYIFEDDETVVPMESGWFTEVNGTMVVELRDRDMYLEDWLGLKELDERGALKFKTTAGGHMSLSEELLSDVFEKYLGPIKKSSRKVMNYNIQEEL
jgi:palmitoyl-protein thioesterase